MAGARGRRRFLIFREDYSNPREREVDDGELVTRPEETASGRPLFSSLRLSTLPSLSIHPAPSDPVNQPERG